MLYGKKTNKKFSGRLVRILNSPPETVVPFRVLFARKLLLYSFLLAIAETVSLFYGGLGIASYAALLLAVLISVIARVISAQRDLDPGVLAAQETAIGVDEVARGFWAWITRSKAKKSTRMAAFIAHAQNVVLRYRAEAVTALVIFPIGFSQLCRHIYLVSGDFTAQSSDYFYWLRFGYSWILDGLLASITQVFDLPVTSVQATALGTKILVYSYVVVLQLIVLSALYNSLRYGYVMRASDSSDA